MILEVNNSKICRVGWQAGDPGRANVADEVQRPSGVRVSSCSGEVSLLF